MKEGALAREYEDALQWLVDANLVKKIYRSTAPGLPISAYDDLSAFKIYLADVGLLRRLALLAPTAFGEGNRLFTEFKGSLSENDILEAFSNQFEATPRYWSRNNPPYEVDFIIQRENNIIPVEVKAEANTESRSLKKYKEKFGDKVKLRVRFSLDNLKLDNDMLNIPIFMAYEANHLIGLVKKLEIHDIDDINELFKAMVSATLKNGLESELEEELGYSKYDYKNRDTENYRNGHSKKTLKTSFGEMELDIPRDRSGEYEPQIIKKQQTTLSGDIEEKIISMYAKGMTTGDIEGHIQEIYGLSVSDSTVSRITDKILPIAKEWQSRPLEKLYAVVFMDAIHYHVRKEGHIVKKAVYIAIGIDLNGMKDVLGMWVGENESAKF